MKNWLLYGLIIVLAGLALISWQTANSLSQELAVRNDIIQDLYQTVASREAEIDDYAVSFSNYKDEALIRQIELNFVIDSWQRQYNELKANPISKTIYLPYPVEELVYKPTTDFQTLEELRQFVEPIGIVIPWDGGCYDAALFYWQKAFDQGKRVYLDSVTPAEYNSYFTKRVQQADEGHIVVSAVIGRQLYWLDPSTAEIILRGELKQ